MIQPAETTENDQQTTLLTGGPIQIRGASGTEDTGLTPLTVNEIRKIFNRITAPIHHTIEHAMHWSRWRRTSQARARTSHYHRHRHHKVTLQY